MAITRNFTYNGHVLPDPGLEVGVEDVRLMYASQYPELTNAVTVYNDPKGNIQEYEFKEKAKAGSAASGRTSSSSGNKIENIEFKPSVGRKA